MSVVGKAWTWPIGWADTGRTPEIGSSAGVKGNVMWWLWIVGVVGLIVAVVIIENRRGSKGVGREFDEHPTTHQGDKFKGF